MIERILRLRFKSWLCQCVAVAALLGAPAARADTLNEALAAAYEHNPTINAERARLRATDEELARAQSGYRPDISLGADYGVAGLTTGVTPLTLSNGGIPSPGQILSNNSQYKRNDGMTRPGGYAVTLSQPLFQGFRTLNAVKEADANIMAGRQALRETEQKVLLETITAYMDVMRDAAIATLRQKSLQVLSTEARATQERFAAGEMTRTDVAQARSRQAQAEAALQLAKSALRSSLASYERFVGHVPVRLTDPNGYEQILPHSQDEAIAVAMGSNPQVLQAAYLERASGSSVRKIEGEMLPDVRLQAQHTERFDPTPTIDHQINQSVIARVNIPIYQSGDVEARVRQAKQQRQGRLEEIEAAREQVRAAAISTYAEVQAMRAQLSAVRQQVQAATESLTGVTEEQKAGQRTLLDVLNAEQELTNAKVSAVRAKHDMVVSAYTLLQAMGRLSASDLGLDVRLYDAVKHYAETNRKWIGVSVERDQGYAGVAPEWGSSVQRAQ